MPIPLTELLELVPADTKEQVRRAQLRLNTPVREALRKLTALRLNAGLSGDQRSGGRSDVTVSIHLVPGLPAALQGKVIEDDKWLAALLAVHRLELLGLQNGVRAVGRLIPRIQVSERGRELLAGRGEHAKPVGELAEALLQEARKFEIKKWIFDVEDDVLGAYFPGTPSLFATSGSVRIELYWAVIGLVARMIGVPAYDLAAVVLAHELAHAYTHVGADIDGHRWDTVAFTKSDRKVVEGLAQYYTYCCCTTVAGMPRAAERAFNSLLDCQRDAYHAHQPWVENHTREEVRWAMIARRRAGAVTLEELEDELENAKQTLRRK